MRVKRPRSVKDRVILGAAWPAVEKSIRAGIAAFEPLLRAEVDRLADADGTVDSVAARSS